MKYPEIHGSDGKVIPIFEFYYDIENMAWTQWTQGTYEFQEELVYSKIFVPTL